MPGVHPKQHNMIVAGQVSNLAYVLSAVSKLMKRVHKDYHEKLENTYLRELVNCTDASTFRSMIVCSLSLYWR
jgi:hypothetical protein